MASYCPETITVLSKEASIPRRSFTVLAAYFHFWFVFTAVGGEELSLSVSAKFTKQCPDVQLSHFICLSLGFSKRCEEVEFHLTYSKSLLICWHSPSCLGGSCEAFQSTQSEVFDAEEGVRKTGGPPWKLGELEKGLLFVFSSKTTLRSPRTSLNMQTASCFPYFAQIVSKTVRPDED